MSPPVSEGHLPFSSSAPLGFGIDSATGKKLSLDMATFMAARTDLAGSRFFDMYGNVNAGANSAYVFYRNGTIVYSVCSSLVGAGSFFYEMRKNNTAINFGGSTDIETDAFYTMDIDFNAGDKLQFFWSNTNVDLTQTPVVNFGIRWRV